MTFSSYLSEHWGLLVLLTGILIVLYLDIHLERRMVIRIAVTYGMIFLYSVSDYIETYLSEQAEYTVIRPLLSATDYSLITFILVNIILIVYPMHKLYLYIPAVINAVLCFISVPTGIVFYINEENHFVRGMLGFLTYFVDALYMAYLIYRVFRNKLVQKEDYGIVVFMSVTSVICLVFPLFADGSVQWFNITVAVDLTMYYIFLLQQYTKRDPLTKLLNRQSYYSDTEKYAASVTAVVTIDMDGLKELNDSKGHVAGDTALKALADCFLKASRRGQRVYRIGGDEYIILCIGNLETEVMSLIERIRKEVAKTDYTCSIGYAFRFEGSTIEILYKKADEVLYEEKKEFYLRTGKHR
ncbi:diguanylate cyclase (GGDEF) domain-containing protein [Ruminococcaceae bacterium FB2012]|nr:diguanylate cyclase (GGDEF) domain-containing protein [Ruminococcaceae bacterium FB2012]